MTDYAPPLRSIDFALHQVAGADSLGALPPFAHADAPTVREVLAEAGRFAREVIAPIDRTGDLQGASLGPDGRVRTAEGFAPAWRSYVDSGWSALACDPTHGGGGFPWAVGLAVQEMLASASRSFGLATMLTHAAVHLLGDHAGEAWPRLALPNLVSGRWTGTMNMTEPHAGSDVGALTTRAEPAGDGAWRIRGQKIFITWGDHDMADNIVHVVLARTPGAPAGTRGISCFAVPAVLVGPDGALGERNDLRCLSLERKVGIHASPTCVMSFGERDGALGYLIGEECAGMRSMFQMMNPARLSVGIEGLAVAERAQQAALAYARQRRQGRAPGASGPDPSPIVEHPDVRRMLLTMRSCVDAMRYLTTTNAVLVDRSRHEPDPAARSRAGELADLLTPVSKAWCTDLGVEVASTALQVHGGMGYIEETGVAQLWRDARVSPIYEGTNGIQAIDLVRRKLPVRGGASVREHLEDLAATARDLAAGGPGLAELATPLDAAVDSLAVATEWLLAQRSSGGRDPLAGATPYLALFGLVTAGALHGRAALAARRLQRADGDPDGFLAARVISARSFCTRLLPQAGALVPAVTAGAEDLFALAPEQLGG